MTENNFAKKVSPDALVEADEASEHGGRITWTETITPNLTVKICPTAPCIPTDYVK